MGDPDRLRRVVVNLLSNAIKFTEHGEVVLHLEVENRTANDVRIRFEVVDTGIGVPLEKQQLIFEAFNQADTSSTRRFGGTGLGLTISSLLVKLMEGKIWVESEPARGSTFQFTAKFALPKLRRSLPLDRAPFGDLRVLVVDDNGTNREILREMLECWGCYTVGAESGEAALRAVQQAHDSGHRFSVLLVDSRMPDVDGFTFLSHLKGHHPELARAAILMLTRSGQRHDAELADELGIAAHLDKPIRQLELLSAVLQVSETRTPGPIQTLALTS
jgi:CheY-like chemotaxis protein